MSEWPLGLVAVDETDRSLVRQYRVGPAKNFVYILGDPRRRECAVVDPAWNPLGLAEEAGTTYPVFLLTANSAALGQSIAGGLNSIVPVADAERPITGDYVRVTAERISA